MKRIRPRTIAPRLASGDKRESIGHGLPPHIKDGIRRIAASENQSVSWVLEKVIIQYFNMETPEYVVRKNEEDETVHGQVKQRAGVISNRFRRQKSA